VLKVEKTFCAASLMQIKAVTIYSQKRPNLEMYKRTMEKLMGLPQCSGQGWHAGQQLAYIYYESEPDRRSAAKLLSKDVARRIAATAAAHYLTRDYV
jgi:hypothetical protein